MSASVRCLRIACLTFVLALTSVAPVLAARISGIGLLDYRRKNFKVGDWVRYRIDVDGRNGEEASFLQEVRIVGEEEFRGEPCFWVETWFGPDSTNVSWDLTLMSYDAFKDPQADVRFSVYTRLMMFETDDSGLPTMTEVRRQNSTAPLPDLSHLRGEVDTLGTEKVTLAKGVVDAQLVSLHRKMRNPRDMGDSTLNRITDLRRKQWLSRRVPVTSLAKEEETEDWLTQTYRVGDPSTNAPEVLQSTEVRHVEAIAWGTGAKSQLLADWHKKKKSAVEMPNIKLPE